MVAAREKFKGVCRHRNTGRWEAHVWLSNIRPDTGHARTGRQLYVGGHRTAELAARAWDLAALKFRCDPATNFPRSEYAHLQPILEAASPDEWVGFLRDEFDEAHLLRAASHHKEQHEHLLWAPCLVPRMEVILF
jgi:hypothetical protein